MTATVPSQSTAALPRQTGPLTVPLEIIRAVGARHRIAVQTRHALPGWALAAVTVYAVGLIAFAVIEWRAVGSPLLIACALIGALAAFAPDLLAARSTRTAEDVQA